MQYCQADVLFKEDGMHLRLIALFGSKSQMASRQDKTRQDKTRQDKTFINIILQVQFFGTQLAKSR